MTRVRLLRSQQHGLKSLAYKLRQQPTEKREKLALGVPFSAKKMASADELERLYGIEVMEKLAEKLDL